MKKILILVEGETEKRLVATLNLLGKVQIINLWQKPVSKIIPRIKEDIVIIIYDADTLDQIDFFKKNLNTLQKHNIKFYLVQQTHNLEDEIIACSKCKKIQEVFNTQGIRDFKSEWLKCQNLSKKLEDINFQKSKLWNGSLIAPLQSWGSCKKAFNDLKTK